MHPIHFSWKQKKNDHGKNGDWNSGLNLPVIADHSPSQLSGDTHRPPLRVSLAALAADPERSVGKHVVERAEPNVQ